MSIFDDPTTEIESPEMGQEEIETGAEETEVIDQELPEEEAVEDVAQDEEETPSEEEQGEPTEFDFETAYRELRGDYTRKTQELAELKKQNSQAQPPQGQVEDMGSINDQFIADFNQDPVGTLFKYSQAFARQEIEQTVSPLYEQQSAQAYAKNMRILAGDYPELKTAEGNQALNGKLNEIAQEFGNPNLVHNPSQRLLKMAAQEAFGDTKAKVFAKAKAKGKQEAYDNIRSKQGLSAPVGTKPKEQPKSIDDEIADSIVAAGRRGGIFG